MGSCLYGIHKGWKEKFVYSVYGMEVLDFLCWGVKQKYGLYAPMTREQCKTVATILRNKLNIITVWKNMNKQEPLREYKKKVIKCFFKRLFSFKKRYIRKPKRIIFNTWMDAHNIFIIINRKKDYLNSEETIDFITKAADFFDRIDGLHDVNGFNEE